jgi:AbrB family looped-hinge helix DNA binding protein
MKTIGIVRRMDDLGRVVIPRGIRLAAGLKEGDPLEFFLNKDNEITLIPLKENTKIVDNFIETFKEFNKEDQKAILKDLIKLM